VEQVTLGRTGLRVSVAGLGCGGDSHLGLDTGGNETQALEVIRRAVELGITYFDTADEYGTEEVVGTALLPVRDEVVISTKTKPLRPDGSLLDAKGLRLNIERSLKRLQTDRADVFFLHMVRERHYRYCVEELLPMLDECRSMGLIGSIAITEGSRSDPEHAMLQAAVSDNYWDVMMLAFNPFNQSARDKLFPMTIANDVGVDVMCAARGPFSHPGEMREVVAALIAAGDLDASVIDREDPFGFVVHHGGASSVIDAAYRFARHEPGCNVILTGTGSVAHLEQNVASIGRGPLPEDDVRQIQALFGRLQRKTKD